MTRCLPASRDGVREAAEALRCGKLVAFPTETVYGLGAIATDSAAVAGIFAAKGRPTNNPLILHVARVEQAAGIAKFDQRAERLAATFWPGPLTLVLPLSPDSGIVPAATAGLDTVAIRIPRHPTALRLLGAVALPVAAPSANRSGAVSPTTAAHVLADLESRIDMVLDAGPVELGIESTVVDLSRSDVAYLLRPGSVTRTALQHVIGPLAAVAVDPGSSPRSPGLLARHYSPRTPLRLDAETVAADEALLAFGPKVPEGALLTLNLSQAGSVEEAAHHLYAMLRRLDDVGARRIAVMKLPEDGLGEAIADRLRRAAAD
jgi:L-threonylcarbamoyladenylate synthase